MPNSEIVFWKRALYLCNSNDCHLQLIQNGSIPIFVIRCMGLHKINKEANVNCKGLYLKIDLLMSKNWIANGYANVKKNGAVNWFSNVQK